MARAGVYANFPAFLLAAVLVLLSVTPAWAGAGNFEGSDEDRNLLHFLGDTRGEDGKPIPGVRVTITVATGEVDEMSDGNGLFFFDSRDMNYDPARIAFSCAKAGYKDVTGNKARLSGDQAPIMVTCLMQRQ